MLFFIVLNRMRMGNVGLYCFKPNENGNVGLIVINMYENGEC